MQFERDAVKNHKLKTRSHECERGTQKCVRHICIWTREKRRRERGGSMQKTKTNKASEIRALKRMKEREIDTSDIPPTADWSKAVVGLFYRPIKKPVMIRLDADVLH